MDVLEKRAKIIAMRAGLEVVPIEEMSNYMSELVQRVGLEPRGYNSRELLFDSIEHWARCDLESVAEWVSEVKEEKGGRRIHFHFHQFVSRL